MTLDASPLTGLSSWLAAPEPVDDIAALADRWRDVDIAMSLAPVVPCGPGMGAHLRRSFLGALGPGASPAARAGQPCTWDPPCALDIFNREQLRRGSDGLPKPYVLFWDQAGPVLTVRLRLFGTACDWAFAAAEALAAGLTGILPWDKVVPGQRARPDITARQIVPGDLRDIGPGPVTVTMVTPLDVTGQNPDGPDDPGVRLLSRAVRRVDAVARWQGLSLTEEATRGLTATAHVVRGLGEGLARDRHLSANRARQARINDTVTGQIALPPLALPLRVLLALAERTHLGRHTNEGMGVIACVTGRHG
jgi:hypothetical protein